MELVEVLLSEGNVVKGEQLRIPNSSEVLLVCSNPVGAQFDLLHDRILHLLRGRDTRFCSLFFRCFTRSCLRLLGVGCCH